MPQRGSVLRNSPQLRQRVEKYILEKIDEVVQNSRKGRSLRRNPFFTGLPKRVLRASRIERSLSANSGIQYQEIAADIARSNGYIAQTEVPVAGRMPVTIRNYIDKVTAKRKTAAPNVAREYAILRKRLGEGLGQTAAEDVTLDLFVNIKGDEYYFCMKTPQPNSEQTRSIKARLLEVKTLRLPDPVRAIAVLPYNPDPKRQHRTGSKYLDYDGKEVLVGREFWDLLGGRGTYTQLVSLFGKVFRTRRRALDEVFLRANR